MTEQTPVRPGQVWADNDKRSKGRRVQVVSVDATHATVAPADSLDGRWTRIRLDRFRATATGYRLVQDTEGAALPQPVVTSDPVAGAIYIRVRDGEVAKTGAVLNVACNVDRDADDRVLGIEILGPSGALEHFAGLIGGAQ